MRTLGVSHKVEIQVEVNFKEGTWEMSLKGGASSKREIPREEAHRLRNVEEDQKVEAKQSKKEDPRVGHRTNPRAMMAPRLDLKKEVPKPYLKERSPKVERRVLGKGHQEVTLADKKETLWVTKVFHGEGIKIEKGLSRVRLKVFDQRSNYRGV